MLATLSFAVFLDCLMHVCFVSAAALWDVTAPTGNAHSEKACKHRHVAAVTMLRKSLLHPKGFLSCVLTYRLSEQIIAKALTRAV